MYQTFIFDLDGLLIDSEIVSYRIFNDLLKDIHTITLDEYSSTISGRQLIDIAGDFHQLYLPDYSVEEIIDKVHDIEVDYIERGIPLKEGAQQLLEYLRKNNKTIVLATSSTPDRAKTILKDNHIIDYFDDFSFGYEVDNGKPAPDIFLLAANKSNTPLNECVVLEDSEAGIDASYSAHIDVICVPDMKKPSIDHINKTIHTFNSLLDVINLLESNK